MFSSSSGVAPKTGVVSGACVDRLGIFSVTGACGGPGADGLPKGTSLMFDAGEAAPNNGGVPGRRDLEFESMFPESVGGAVIGTDT